jgi:uncharacterized protein with PQ loop repeat
MSLEFASFTHSHIKNKKKHDRLHSKLYVRNLDRCVLVCSVVSPVMTLPQVWQAWSTHNVGGLSLITWSAWLFFSVFWLFYGLAHEERPIIINNILWIFIHSAVITAILLFR